MTLFRNKRIKTGSVPNVGVIVDGLIESPIKLEGPDWEEVVEAPQQSQPTAQVAAPAAPPVSPPPVQPPVQPPAQPNPQTVQNTNIGSTN